MARKAEERAKPSARSIQATAVAKVKTKAAAHRAKIKASTYKPETKSRMLAGAAKRTATRTASAAATTGNAGATPRKFKPHTAATRAAAKADRAARLKERKRTRGF